MAIPRPSRTRATRWIVLSLASFVLLGWVGDLSFEAANRILIATKDSVVRYFDWLFIAVASATLGVVVLLGIVPSANVRLGRDDDEPEFSRFSWLAMIFSAGLASDLLYWSVAEPIIHLQGNPFLGATLAQDPESGAAATTALRITLFHWGLHGWGMYVLGALAIGLASYRNGRPLTIRSALHPILGDRWVDRWPGRTADWIALVGTIFGVATSIGLAAAALNATLWSGFDLAMSAAMQISVVFFVCLLGVLSAMSGLGRGIRRLSEINVWVSAVFLGAILVLGPTLAVAQLTLDATLEYLLAVLPDGLWVGESVEDKRWQSDWTVFYWGWWLAWMPFVSLFIARISKGRTVREVVVVVMAVPSLLIVVWMGIVGGTALGVERLHPGSVSIAVNQDHSLGVVALLEGLATPTMTLALTAVAAFLLFTWLITSLDSATLVIGHLLERPDSRSQQALWGLVLAVVTAVLIAAGGLSALQAAAIIVGLPLAGVIVLMGLGLLRDLFRDRL